MSEPLYAILNGPADFATYPDARVPHPVRRTVKNGELVVTFDDARPDGMYDCELSDGTVIRASYLNLTVLPYVSVGNEVAFDTPAVVRSGTRPEPAQRRSGTIIAVCTGRQFGYALVQGSEPNAYLVPVLDIIYGE